MKSRTRLLLGLTLVFTALIAWSAIGPHPYASGPDGLVTRPYPWNLPALFLAFGLVVTALLSLTKSSLRFFASVIASCIGGALVFLLLLSAMHSPSGHEVLFFVVLGWTIGLFVYSGYTLAVWRVERNAVLNGNAE